MPDNQERPTYEQLEAALTEVQIKFTEQFNQRLEAERDLARAEAALVTERHRVGVLRDALAFYRDSANYDEGLPANSMMSKDRGAKAEYALRLTAGADDPEGA